MRLVDEKRALAEVTDLRRARKAFDSFGSAQESIDADKAKIEELKSTLDNPEYKSLNDRYEAIQKELDELNKELEAGNKNRDVLYDERNKLHDEVNALWSRKKESAGNFKEANDRYCKLTIFSFSSQLWCMDRQFDWKLTLQQRYRYQGQRR